MDQTDQTGHKKKMAAERAVGFIEDGMTIGLGSGSTVFWAIRKLGKLVDEGWSLKGIPTSKQTEKWAYDFGIPLTDFSKVEKLDAAIDGADEIDPGLNLIKGGGGALLREKLIASTCRKLIIVADDSKLVTTLGQFPLPVEIIPFGWEATVRKLEDLGCSVTLRKDEGNPFKTDNGNYIADCSFNRITEPFKLNQILHLIPGVVETGLFVDMTDTVIIGYADETKIFMRNQA